MLTQEQQRQIRQRRGRGNAPGYRPERPHRFSDWAAI